MEVTDDGETFANGDIDNVSGGAIANYDNATVTVAVELSGKTIKTLYSIATWTAEDAVQFQKDDLDEDSVEKSSFLTMTTKLMKLHLYSSALHHLMTSRKIMLLNFI
ncbi:MAG: hypothetical protein HFG67_05665 [Firmicutes bacterium]|nr:hypothetical protein [Bacillota bacterium]